MVQQDYFLQRIANSGNSSVEFQVVFENEKFTIKDSILTRLNEKGKKEEIIEDTKLSGSKFYYGASHMKLINQFYDLYHQIILMIMFM